NTGYSQQGIDLGSANFSALELIKPMILAGPGVSSGEVGEIWHLMDQRLNIPLSMVETRFFNGMDIHDYNVIIMPSGRYDDIDSNGIEKLKQWLRFGNTLIAIGSANNWLEKSKLASIKFKKRDEINKDKVTVRRPYGDASNYSGAQVIGGSIFSADLDLTHPIGYGFERSDLAVFVSGSSFMELTPNPYNSPLVFKKKALLSGFVSKENYKLVDSSAAITIFGQGRGQIISFAEDPNFRAFWYGTNRLFMNALVFGQIIYSPSY
ncbi:MAG: zinc carboxypeptidase, partial [Calditrichaeota bacterium]|nr:zinc carboxypeptidase [Calditrichota bacterium]